MLEYNPKKVPKQEGPWMLLGTNQNAVPDIWLSKMDVEIKRQMHSSSQKFSSKAGHRDSQVEHPLKPMEIDHGGNESSVNPALRVNGQSQIPHSSSLTLGDFSFRWGLGGLLSFLNIHLSRRNHLLIMKEEKQ